MVYSLSYRRPAHVESSRASVETEKSGKQESISSGGSCSYGIPPALSFDKIISGGTCPVSLSTHNVIYPCTDDVPIACDHPRVHGLPCVH
jgi:hypothetical protein